APASPLPEQPSSAPFTGTHGARPPEQVGDPAAAGPAQEVLHELLEALDRCRDVGRVVGCTKLLGRPDRQVEQAEQVLPGLDEADRAELRHAPGEPDLVVVDVLAEGAVARRDDRDEAPVA